MAGLEVACALQRLRLRRLSCQRKDHVVDRPTTDRPEFGRHVGLEHEYPLQVQLI